MTRKMYGPKRVTKIQASLAHGILKAEVEEAERSERCAVLDMRIAQDEFLKGRGPLPREAARKRNAARAHLYDLQNILRALDKLAEDNCRDNRLRKERCDAKRRAKRQLKLPHTESYTVKSAD